MKSKGKTLNVQQPHCAMFTILRDKWQLQNLCSLVILHVQPSRSHYCYFCVNLFKYKLYILLSKNIHSALTFSITVNNFFQLKKCSYNNKLFATTFKAHGRPYDFSCSSFLPFYPMTAILRQLCQRLVCVSNSVNAHFAPDLSLKPHLY